MRGAGRGMRLVFRYWKPAGVLSTTLPCKDGQNILQHSPHLASFLSETTNNQFVVPVGRLDKASAGLLLLTTDPSVCALLLRPGEKGSQISKEYHVSTSRRIPDNVLVQMRQGVQIKNRRKMITTLPCIVERLSSKGTLGSDDGSSKCLQFILKEGKNRQIRKMVGAFSYAVEELLRVRFGTVSLDGLEEGEASLLNDKDVERLLL